MKVFGFIVLVLLTVGFFAGAPIGFICLMVDSRGDQPETITYEGTLEFSTQLEWDTFHNTIHGDGVMIESYEYMMPLVPISEHPVFPSKIKFKVDVSSNSTFPYGEAERNDPLGIALCIYCLTVGFACMGLAIIMELWGKLRKP